MATYKKYATKNGTPIQVQSAIEDGQGRQIDETYVEHNSYDGTLSVGYSDSTGAIKTEYGVELNAGATIDGHLDEPFLFRPTAYPFNRDVITIGGQKATVKQVRAYAFVKNQVFDYNLVFPSQTKNGITIVNNNDGSFSVNGTATATTFIDLIVNFQNKLTANHIYLWRANNPKGVNGNAKIADAYGGILLSTNVDKIVRYESGKVYLSLQVANGAVCDNEKILPQVIDLTQWFNNDTTILSKTGETWFIPWFLNNFGKYIPTYSTGEIENTYATQITTNGVNQWDEIATSTGYISDLGNVVTGYGNRIASTNYIRVYPNTAYYVKAPYSIPSYGIRVAWYDVDKNLILVQERYSIPFTSPENACYMRFNTHTQYGSTTYNNDIQICLHWTETEIEQTYHPYEKWVFNIDWSAIGTPLGINSRIGDYKDFVNGKNGKVVGSVDLETLSWTVSQGCAYSFSISSTIKHATNNIISNLPSSINRIYVQSAGAVVLEFTIGTFNSEQELKAALPGVILQYELAEPTLTDMTESEKLTNTYNVNDYGTEGVDEVCALDVLYQNNLVRQIVNNQTATANHEQRIRALETEVEGIKGLPTAPSTNGNYRLRCTVADGVATYTWVAES